ncbi:GTP 3',8-cyclase MoaA [uncultured Cohaesibacter sp.]|uniref:GTP 3',8-cyclase MoaA n=1 Tax=uncultured Cohaesibacter sp. TaxID=1002546 RepID=UPI00292DB6D0|nr:GTP 3',8-cyclase MoaA [uncultured Cohaesibacter sp.]
MACFDPHGRKIEYVRLSVTDKCNLRCFYCMPEHFRDFTPSSEYLSYDELIRIISAFAELGIFRVRLTGGEPLVRKDLAGFAKQLSAIPGIEDLSLSTNCVLMDRHAEDLFEAGVNRLNVSLDTLREDRFRFITRRGGNLELVLNGLKKAKQVGFSPIKLNMLVMRGINDDEVIDIANYCLENAFSLRFIETMPIGASGQKATDHYINLREVRDRLDAHFNLVPSIMRGGGPARYVRVEGTNVHFGFITPLSQHFCSSCNRLRLTAEGTLHLCLGNTQNFELKPHIRQGISDDGLKGLLYEALALKPLQHNFLDNPSEVNRSMSVTGG